MYSRQLISEKVIRFAKAPQGGDLRIKTVSFHPRLWRFNGWQARGGDGLAVALLFFVGDVERDFLG